MTDKKYPINHHVLAENFRKQRAGTQAYNQGDGEWLMDALQTMCNAYDELADFDYTIDTPQGTYTPITDGHYVGFRFEQHGEPARYIVLNPSGDSDDGQPNVFVYEGTNADINEMTPSHFYDIGEKVDPLYEQMRIDLESGECAVINHDSNVSFCGKPLGQYPEWDEAIAVIKDAMNKAKFWPNIYTINDHGNVSLLDGDGNEVKGWV